MGPRGPSACGWDPHGTEGWVLSRGSHSRTCGGFQPLRGWKEWILTDTLISALATTPCLTYQHESCPGDIFADGTFTFYLNLQKL